jgi:hypothetical protein
MVLKFLNFFLPPKSATFISVSPLIEMGGCLNLEWIFIIKIKIKIRAGGYQPKSNTHHPNTRKEDGAKKVSLPEEQHVMCVCVCVCVHTIMGTTTTKFVVG